MSIPLVNLFQFTMFFLCALLSGFVYARYRSVAMSALLFVLGLHAGLRGLEKFFGPECFNHSYTLVFLYGPLLYFMVKGLLRPDIPFQKYQYLHFVTYLVALVMWANSLLDKQSTAILAVIIQTFYILFTYREIRNFETVIQHTKSDGTPETVTWLKRAMGIYFGCFVFMFARTVVSVFVPEFYIEGVDMLFFIVVSMVLAAMIFKGLMSSQLIPQIDAEEVQISEQLEVAKVQLQDQGVLQLNPNQQRLVKKIESFMEDEKPYTDPQLTVKQLAEQLAVPARQLSEVINEHWNVSFSEYINRARVAETQRLMGSKSWADRSLLDIALVAGFNSKSSFNLMFKRFTDITPSAYRKMLNAKPPHIAEAVSH